jgi:hypothetical protein
MLALREAQAIEDLADQLLHSHPPGSGNILEGRQPATLELEDPLKQFPIAWDQQLGSFTEGGYSRSSNRNSNRGRF